MSDKGRNELIDWIKGILIIFVIWGHAQNALLEGAVVYTAFKEITATFCMPMFALISGYCLKGVNKRTYLQHIIGRTKRILIPCLCWNLITNIIDACLFLIKYKKITFITIVGLIDISEYWFLWAVYICDIIVCAIDIFCKNKKLKIVAYCMTWGLLIMLPELPYDLWYTAWVFPFFCIGFEMSNCKSKKAKQLVAVSNSKGLFMPLIIVFLILQRYFDTAWLVYVAGSSIWAPGYSVTEHVAIDAYRICIGIAGCFCAYKLFRIAYNTIKLKDKFQKTVCLWGRLSLQLYLLHAYILARVLTICMHYLHTLFGFSLRNHIFLTGYVLAPVVAILLVILCTEANKIICKTKIGEIIMGMKRIDFMG